MTGGQIPPLARVPIKYGLIGGLMGIILVVMLYIFNRFPMLPLERVFLLGVFIFFSIKEFKEYYNDGFLHFWQGMLVGIMCYIVLALIVALFLWIWGVFSSVYVDAFINIMSERLQQNGQELLDRVGKEAYNAQMDKLPLTTMTDLAIDYLLKTMVIGIFLTIIISVILRRQPKLS